MLPGLIGDLVSEMEDATALLMAEVCEARVPGMETSIRAVATRLAAAKVFLIENINASHW
jgi:hypothetical protein